MIKVVSVLGSGLMGSGIAQASATAGYRTIVRDITPQLLDRSLAAISRSLARLVEKAKVTDAEREAALARLEFTTDLRIAAPADLVIEAVTEDLSLKNEIWSALDPMAAHATIFASNTSSLPIAAMAAVTSRPDRFVGLHFFNPVAMMPLVEVVRAISTSPATLETALGFARSLGKEAVVAPDKPGFIVNLLLVPYILDGIRALERGVASIADIDTGMRLGAGHPMGPLTLADFVGLDTLARIGDIMFAEYAETRYATPPLLRRLVTLGMYGRKSGRGFYDYSQDPPVPTPGL